MTQIDIVKAFLEDADIQQKYSLTPDEVTQMTMSSQHNAEAQVLVSLIRQMVNVVEDSGTTVNLAASRLNAHLENALR
ncbi:hypothetical protein [Spirosoma areae]